MYIGQSVDTKKRIGVHKNHLSQNRHINIHLQRAWNKYGEENFVFEIIDEANEQYTLDCLECFWINAYGGYQSDMNYNFKDGGAHGKYSAESKEKISTNHVDFSGENHPLWGKQHSAETKIKISIKNEKNERL